MHLIGDGEAGGQQLPDSADDVVGSHVFPVAVVLVDERNAVMRLPSLLPFMVQELEGVRVFRDQGIAFACGMCKVCGIRGTRNALGARSANIVPGALQLNYQAVSIGTILA